MKIEEIKAWYGSNQIYGDRDGARVDWDDLVEWLSESKPIVKELLKQI
jgi:hypothetical protein